MDILVSERGRSECCVVRKPALGTRAKEHNGPRPVALGDLVEHTERTLEAHSITLEPQAKAHAIVAVYELLDQENSPATAGRIKRLIDALTSGRRLE